VSPPESGLPPWVFAILAVALVAIGAILGVFVWRRRRSNDKIVGTNRLGGNGQAAIVFPSSTARPFSAPEFGQNKNGAVGSGQPAFVAVQYGHKDGNNQSEHANVTEVSVVDVSHGKVYVGPVFISCQ
jgi:hypothetical protein